MARKDHPIFKKLSKVNEYAKVASEGIVSDCNDFFDSGSYVMNALLTGSIFKGYPTNRIMVLAGIESSGKTFLTLHACKNFLNRGEENVIFYFDTESAIESSTLTELDIDKERFYHIPIRDVEESQTQILGVLDSLRENIKSEKVKKGSIMIVLDSLGMMPTKTEVTDRLEDKHTADMGRRAKIIKSLFRTITLDLGILDVPMIVTTHSYDSMSQYSPKGLSGGSGAKFSGSTIFDLSPLREREGTAVVGSFIRIVVLKSRFVKQYSKGTMRISYKKGLDRYYGLFDIGYEIGAIKKEGHSYVLPSGGKFKKDEILNEPEKCFTKEDLEKMDEYIKKHYGFGTGEDGEVVLNDVPQIETFDPTMDPREGFEGDPKTDWINDMDDPELRKMMDT